MRDQQTQKVLFEDLASEHLEEADTDLLSDRRYVLDDASADRYLSLLHRSPSADAVRAGESMIVVCERDNDDEPADYNYTVIGDLSGRIHGMLLIRWDGPDTARRAEAFGERLHDIIHDLR